MEKDICAKEFFSDGGRYADIINGLGCGGRQIVTEEDLQEKDTQVGILKWRNITGRLGKKRRSILHRDLLRRTAFGMNFAVIGIENQEALDYALPLRVMNYDVLEYTAQATTIRKKLRKQKGLYSGEYLYGFGRESRLYPAITFVLYFGEEEWDGARDLHGIIDFTDIPEELRKMVPNYHIQLIEVRKLEDTSVFKTDVRQVFDFIRCANDREMMERLINSDAAYHELEEDAYDMVTQYTGADEMIRVKAINMKGGRVNMCKAINDMMLLSREEGREEGRIEYQTDTIRKLLSKGYTCEAIADMLDMDKNEVKKIQTEMLQTV